MPRGDKAIIAKLNDDQIVAEADAFARLPPRVQERLSNATVPIRASSLYQAYVRMATTGGKTLKEAADEIIFKVIPRTEQVCQQQLDQMLDSTDVKH